MSKQYKTFHSPFNALKHGVYSNMVVLPTEDPAEFEKLQTSLIAELQPSGALEHDAVCSIAHLTWRKKRLNIFRKAEFAREELTPHFKKPFPEQLAEALRRRQKKLKEALAENEAQKSMDKWIDVERKLAKENERVFAFEESDEEMRQKLMACCSEAQDLQDLAHMAEFITPERYIKDLELEARIDSQIDRQLKRLWLLKSMKEVAGLHTPPKGQGERALTKANGG
jgi:hypothetical protein